MQIIIIAYGAVFIAYLVARFTVGERWTLVAVANVLLPWLCAVGIVLGVIGLLFPNRWALAGLHLPALLVFAVTYGSLFLPAKPVPAATGPALTVASFNVHG